MENNANVQPGYIIDLTNGTMSKGADGERQITGSYSVVSSGKVSPVNMTGRTFYCGPLIVDDTSRTIVEAQGVTDGVGTHHIGTFARASGTITEKGSDYLYLWDGSTTPDNLAMTDGIGTGIRVQFPSGGASVLPVDEDDFISFSGISGLRVVNGDHLPVLKSPECNVELVFDPVNWGPCDDIIITVTATICGIPISGEVLSIYSPQGNSSIALDPSGPWSGNAEQITDINGSACFLLRPEYDSKWDDLTAYVSTSPLVSHRVDYPQDYIVSMPGLLWVVDGEERTVSALVKDALGNPVSGVEVTLEADYGYFNQLIGQSTYTGLTDSNGIVSVTYEADVCETSVTVSATAVVEPCQAIYSTQKTVIAYCTEPDFPYVEIFWCIDVTSSMGTSGSPVPSIVKFLEDMENEGIPIKSGGVKFNDIGENGDHIYKSDPRQYLSLDSFQDQEHFIDTWLTNGFNPSGGDPPELQLNAIMIAAEDLNNKGIENSPFRYIVLVTDTGYHEGNIVADYLTRYDVFDYVNSSGLYMYISIWGENPSGTWDNFYKDFEEISANEYVNYDTQVPEIRYPFITLRYDILSNWIGQ